MRRTLIVAATLSLIPLALIEPVAHAVEGCAPAEHAGGEWRTFGPDLGNTRSQAAETTIGPLEAATLAPAFTVEVPGGTTGTPVIADGCLYVGGGEGTVVAANADTGAPVWQAEAPEDGSINSTLAVVDGTVYAFVSRAGSPYAFALDQATGALKWGPTVLDTQVGSDSYSSPVVHDGIVIAGVSGGSAELGDEADRYAFQGAYVLLDAATGDVLHKEWVIHEPAPDGIGDGYAGATVWSTPAVDAASGFAYVGTSNPFQPQKEHANANAVIKIDLRRELEPEVPNPAFGTIVDSYKGIVDEYFPALSDLPCGDIEGNPPPWYPQGAGACADIDLDFGAAPNLFTDESGRVLVGAGQKAGVYHAIDPETMDAAWTQIVGPPGAVGGIVGTAALTTSGIAGPITPGGYLWSISNGGSHQWASPVADGLHWGHQTSTANGVVYTMDLKGFLDAYDAATGLPVLHRPMNVGSDASFPAGGLGGGVAIARNTVYAAANGYVVAFRPGETPGGGGGEPPVDPGLPEGVEPTVVSGPGATFAGYLTPVMVAEQGGPLSYTNLDAAQHDVVSDARGADGKPLFKSAVIGIGATAPVLGLENVVSGQQYGFYCSLHTNMRGTLVIQ